MRGHESFVAGRGPEPNMGPLALRAFVIAKCSVQYTHGRRLMAAAAPAEARSCLALTLRPAARGRLLEALAGMPLVPVLVRLMVEPVAVPLTADTLRVAPDTGLCGLTPDDSRGLIVGPDLMPLPPGGSGRGRGADMVLCRFTGEASRAGIRGTGIVAFLPVMNSW